MIPLTEEQQELHEKSRICYICKKNSIKKYTKDKTIVKLGTIEVMRIPYVF